MGWTVQQLGDLWRVARDGDEVAIVDSYPKALAALTAAAGPPLVAAAGAGLLPEAWEDTGGIAFSEPTGDGRDFSACAWSWRDPASSLLPLMLQTTTDVAHFGAVLAGFIERIWLDGTTPRATGRFYDHDAGVQFRDLLLDGRVFGVSVDPGSVTAEFICAAEDDDGWCVEGSTEFSAYEIIGLTGTPFPAFADAAIQLGTVLESTDAPADDTADPMMPEPDAVTAGMFPARPPASFFEMDEPALGDPLLVEQFDVFGEHAGWAVPLTITDDGHVFGHLAYWGQCHVGYDGVCVQPPDSPTNYAHACLRPTVCDDGSSVLTGQLVVGCDHADLSLFAGEARDHYAHAGLAWADVVFADGQLGVWFSGALRPDVTEDQLRVLRSSSVSGDWRPIDGALELLLGLTVNGPGFPIRGQARPAAIAASRLGIRSDGAGLQALVAANVVHTSCTTCGRGEPVVASGSVDELLRLVRSIEGRTRHLAPVEARFRAARVTR